MSRIVKNPSMVRELARTPWARDLIKDATEEVEREAKLASPLGSDFVGYQGRFKTRTGQLNGTVGNTDVAAHIIEFGSVNNPPYAPLRRGVTAAGLRFADVRGPAQI